MADAQYVPDISSIQGLLSQFQPSDTDRADARRMALLAAGFGLLGTPKGAEFAGLGKAGLLGMQTYQDTLKNQLAQRTQGITEAVKMQGLLRQQQLMNAANALMMDNNSAPAGPSIPAPGIPAGSVGGTGMGGGTAQTFGIGSQPGPVASAQPAQAMRMPTWKQLAPPAAKAMAAASGDPKVVIDLINKYTETKNGPNGLVTTFDGRPLYQSTPEGVQLFDPDTRMPAQFMAYPKEAVAAAANRAGAIKAAETTATEQAQFPYRTITGPFGPNGAPVTGFQSQLLGSPSTAPQATGRQIDLAPTLSPQERAAALRDAQQSGYPQMGYTMPGQGGALVGADPLAMKRAEGQISAQTAQDTDIAKTFAGQYTDLVKGELSAPANIQKYERVKDLYSKVQTGKLAGTVQGLKQIAAYVAPDLAKEWTADVPYAQAAQALSRQMALELRNPAGGAGMPGSLSDADRDYLNSMISTLQNDPRAIPMILDAKIALEQRARDLGKLARQYRVQNGRLDEGFYTVAQQYADSHPLFANAAGATAPTTPAGWSIKRIN